MNILTVTKYGSSLILLTTLFTYIYDLGGDNREATIKNQYNIQIEEQRAKSDRDLKIKIDHYNKSLIDSKLKIDNYWKEVLEKQEKVLIAQHETNLEAERINHDSETIISDNINNDALRLFQQARGIIKPPADFEVN